MESRKALFVPFNGNITVSGPSQAVQVLVRSVESESLGIFSWMRSLQGSSAQNLVVQQSAVRITSDLLGGTSLQRAATIWMQKGHKGVTTCYFLKKRTQIRGWLPATCTSSPGQQCVQQVVKLLGVFIVSPHP